MPRQTAAQRAAKEKAAVEAAAAEQGAPDEETAAVYAAAGDSSSTGEQTAAPEGDEQAAKEKDATSQAKPAAKQKRYVVTGAAVVLPTVDKSERYLYRNAPVDTAAFTPEGIKHALGLGLIAEVK